MLYTFDAEGNVAQRTNAAGTVSSDHVFDAHGISLNASLTEPFGYRARFGYYTDNETGFQLLTHRYYDPATGRFLTRDPISYAGGVNVYSYTGNNPTNRIDPSGLDAGELAQDLPYLAGAGGVAAVSEVAAPVVIIGGLWYGAWQLGECIAEQPWNQLTGFAS